MIVASEKGGATERQLSKIDVTKVHISYQIKDLSTGAEEPALVFWTSTLTCKWFTSPKFKGGLAAESNLDLVAEMYFILRYYL